VTLDYSFDFGRGEDLPLLRSVEPPLDAEPPPFEALLVESDELLLESPLEPPELGEALASPVLD
jgi:hypothetical protein